MSEDVNEYLRKRGTAKNKERMQILLNFGIRDQREYAPDKQESADYPLFDDYRHECFRIPLNDITEEQWTLLEAEWEQKKINEINSKSGGNALAGLLKGAAVVIYIVGLILGFILGRDLRGGISIWNALVYWLVAFVVGTSLLWYAQVLDLLQHVKNNTNLIWTKLRNK